MGEYNAVKISQQIKREILSGDYGQNQMLAEREIAEKFNVSRVPVREALQGLCQEGYLIKFPRKGYLVNRLTEDYIRQLQQVRYHIESLAVLLVLKNASDDEIKSLLNAPPGLNDTNPYFTANTYFHSTLGKLSGNTVLADTIYKHLGDTSLAVFQNPSIIEKRNNCHTEIVEALLERNAEKALSFLAMDMKTEPFLKYAYQ